MQRIKTKTMKRIEIIENKVLYIKEQIGLEIVPTDWKLRTFRGRWYFDIEMDDTSCFSQDLNKLERLSKRYKDFDVIPAGCKRMAIVFDK